MIRWYDYLIIFILADIMSTIAVLLITLAFTGNIVAIVYFTAILYALWYLWDVYCYFRVARE